MNYREIVLYFIILGMALSRCETATSTLSEEYTDRMVALYAFVLNEKLSTEQKETIFGFYENLRQENPEEFGAEMKRMEEVESLLKKQKLLEDDEQPEYIRAQAREFLTQALYGETKVLPLSREMKDLFEKREEVIAVNPQAGIILMKNDYEGYVEMCKFISAKADIEIGSESPDTDKAIAKLREDFEDYTPLQQQTYAHANVIWEALNDIYRSFDREAQSLFNKGVHHLLKHHEVEDKDPFQDTFWQDFFTMMGHLERADKQKVETMVAYLEGDTLLPEGEKIEDTTAEENKEEEEEEEPQEVSDERQKAAPDTTSDYQKVDSTLRNWMEEGRREAAIRQEKAAQAQKESDAKLRKLSPMARALAEYIGSTPGLQSTKGEKINVWGGMYAF